MEGKYFTQYTEEHAFAKMELRIAIPRKILRYYKDYLESLSYFCYESANLILFIDWTSKRNDTFYVGLLKSIFWYLSINENYYFK